MSLLKINSNSKLGKGIGSFNLPQGTTCPGRSQWCEDVCYANKGFFKFPRNQAIYQDAYQATLQDDFVDQIILDCRNHKINAVRLHSTGDFYNEEYINKWFTIANIVSTIKFWAYTRSWAVSSLLPALEQLRKLPNFYLFVSLDDTMDSIPPDDWRIAYCHNEWERPENSFRCPNQASKKEPTCAQCKLCFRPVGKFKHVEFKRH